MADKLDDAQGGEAASKGSYEEQLAAVKNRLGSSDSDINQGKAPVPPEDEEHDDEGAEGDGTQAGNGSGNGGDEDSQDGGSGDGGDDGDGTGSGDEGKPFEGRFTQFKGDGTSDSYVKNLEDGYQNSSQEAIRLKDEKDSYERQVNAIKQAAAQDKEFGARLLGLLNGSGGSDATRTPGGSSDLANKSETDSDNPFLKDAQTTWNKESEKEAEEFAKANPEVMSDPKINADVKRWMRVFSNETYETEGRLMKAGEAMAKAYAYLGLEDKTKSQQDLVNGMKQNAAPTRPPASKSAKAKGSSGTKQFSDLTLGIAQRMGIAKERLEKSKKR